MKFCRQCAEYIIGNHKECPNCGYVFPKQPAGDKLQYYCTRCKRHLLSKICPIHGTSNTIVGKATKANASKAKHPIKQENPAGNSRLKPYLFHVPEEATPASSKLLAVHKKEKTDVNHPLPSSRINGSPETPSIEAFSEQSRIEEKNIKLASNAVGSELQEDTLSSSADISGNSRPIIPLLSGKESSQAIIEGKLFPPLENRNSDLQPEAGLETGQKETDPEKEEKLSQKSNGSTANFITPKPLKGRVPAWLYWAGSAALLFFAVMTLYSFYYPNYVKKSLYERAEEHFSQGRYQAALQLYRECKLRYPGSSIIPEVNIRIRQIQENEIEQVEKQVKIYSLMQKAAESYNKQRYLKPDDSNAMMYIREILQEDSGFVPALTLQNRIVDFYFEQAEKAFDTDRYDKAVMYYENILAIRPHDAKIQADFDRALKLKYVYGMLDDMSALADSREEFKNFQEEKMRLKNQIRQERLKLKEVSQKLENQQNVGSKESKNSAKKSSVQKALKAQPIAVGLTYLSKSGLKTGHQPFESSVNQSQRQSVKISKEFISCAPGNG